MVEAWSKHGSIVFIPSLDSRKDAQQSNSYALWYSGPARCTNNVALQRVKQTKFDQKSRYQKSTFTSSVILFKLHVMSSMKT